MKQSVPWGITVGARVPCWGLPPGITEEIKSRLTFPNGKRQEIFERLNAGAVKVLVATGQLIGEGFDCRALSTLFLTTPIKFDGCLIQYLGRVLRPAPGKEKAVVFDYIDSKVGVLRGAAKSRRRVYGQ